MAGETLGFFLRALPAVVALSVPVGTWAQELPPPAASQGLMDRESLTGDWGGLRHRLDAAGLKLSGVYTGEVLGNPSGGVRQGAVAEGLPQKYFGSLNGCPISSDPMLFPFSTIRLPLA